MIERTPIAKISAGPGGPFAALDLETWSRFATALTGKSQSSFMVPFFRRLARCAEYSVANIR